MTKSIQNKFIILICSIEKPTPIPASFYDKLMNICCRFLSDQPLSEEETSLWNSYELQDIYEFLTGSPIHPPTIWPHSETRYSEDELQGERHGGFADDDEGDDYHPGTNPPAPKRRISEQPPPKTKKHKQDKPSTSRGTPSSTSSDSSNPASPKSGQSNWENGGASAPEGNRSPAAVEPEGGEFDDLPQLEDDVPIPQPLQQPQPTKRRPGRPLGSKNKPKVTPAPSSPAPDPNNPFSRLTRHTSRFFKDEDNRGPNGGAPMV
jgi:hypothetical protein